MSLSEIEHSLHNIKMRKHQVRKDQNSNKFCLCAAHDWRQHCLWHLFPEKKRHRTALSSLFQTIRTHGTKHSEAWAVRTDPEGILHVLSWKAEVNLVKKTPINNKPKLKQPKLLCINIGGIGNISYTLQSGNQKYIKTYLSQCCWAAAPWKSKLVSTGISPYKLHH